MQRRDVETEDKGAGNEAQHPASIETSAPRMQSVCSLAALCSLRPAVCTMHSALCSQSCRWSGLQQMRRFPNCRLVFLFLLLLLLCPMSARVPCPFVSLLFPHTVTAHTVSRCAPNLATFVGLAIHAIPRPQ